METEYGNPSSLHRMGFQAERTVELARKRLAAALFCEPSELYFTSGATEANNLALLGCAAAHGRRGRTVVTTAVEHPSVLEAAKELERQGFTVKRLLPGPDGYTPEQFAGAVDEDTILVSCMLVNNETGLVFPVEEIARAVKRRNPGIFFHCDGVQGFLKLPLRMRGSAVDMLSISGHKVRAPKGVGALYIKKGVRILPRTFGGGQQQGLRSGTEPVPLIAALGAAAEVQRGRILEELDRYRELKARLLSACEGIEGVTVRSGEDCAPHIVSLSLLGVRSEVLLHFLEGRGVYVSSGSACSKGRGSYVLEALGVPRLDADETVRVSFGAETGPEAVDALAAGLREAGASLARQR